MISASLFAVFVTLFTLFDVVAAAASAPTSNIQTRTTLSIPVGTVVGSIVDDVEYYRGIPFAEAPVGPLRLRPPIRASDIGTVQATGTGPSCPQMTNVYMTSLSEEVATIPVVAAALAVLNTAPDITEDCLTISVMRPRGTAAKSGLPVLFWIYGGGFENGSSGSYNGSVLIPQSVAQGSPIILVAVNYRVGGFGFLPGAEVLADGASNLGLLDQRLALEWVADNIASFGGDPEKVTIWGQSAGAFSVFDQMALYGGNITYKNKPLFRAGIMNSGSILPTEPINAPRAQAIFDTVVKSAGCNLVPNGEKLDCLRNLSFEAYWNATNSVPSPFSYHSPVSSFTVRPDGHVIPASPEVLAKRGSFAPVPVIIGDQEDEGTFLSLTQNNLTTQADLITFLSTLVFQNASCSQVKALAATYPYDNGAAGSPFRTGTANEAYPQFKRLAAILGDVAFTMMRRSFLSFVPKTMRTWSYLSTYGYGTPIMGTFHTADLPKLFYGVDDVSRAMQTRYIAFVDSIDPNHGRLAAPAGFQTEWPLWSDGRKLIEFGANRTGVLVDDFRKTSGSFIQDHLKALRT
ncbi:Alpha/Beta hydrolase protein [Nemania sp. NC0429]|nr:Alpha/Beta hydrolase protein [Nemania sp. NC0429]